MPEVVVRGGRVVDETGAREADVLVVGGRVAAVGPGLEPPAGAVVLDAGGCVVTPGLVDIQVHLREPGREEAETVVTGARAAARGGFTAVVAMPNTDPPLDEASVVQAVLERGQGSVCDVHVAGCITLGRRGERLAPMAELHGLGVRVFTDDGDCVADAAIMRRALEYSVSLPGAVIAQHAEDPDLVAGGHMNEGEWSSRLGVPGRPAEAESTIVARDLELVRLTGGRYHVLHLSTAAAADLVRRARAEGLAVSAEVSPQHLTLTDSACATYDPVFKMNPPLRTAADVEALRRALVEDVISAVATDHAPHAPETKAVPFEEAPPGMLGLETAFAVLHTELVGTGVIPLPALLARMSWQPARIAGLEGHGGPVAPDRPAHLCVIDPAARWTVDAGRSASRSRNTPFAGWELTGAIRHTICRGEPVVIDGEVQR